MYGAATGLAVTYALDCYGGKADMCRQIADGKIFIYVDYHVPLNPLELLLVIIHLILRDRHNLLW